MRFTSEEFKERLESLINEEFVRFQTSHGIDTGDLDPWLSNQLDMQAENLVNIMDKCMQWKDSFKQESVQVKTAAAEYTGGGIYVYVGELSDGSWFMTGDLCGNSVQIVDADPLKSWDDAWYPEWQQKHLIREVVDAAFLREILVAVKTALDGGASMNACASEIEDRIQILDEDGEI